MKTSPSGTEFDLQEIERQLAQLQHQQAQWHWEHGQLQNGQSRREYGQLRWEHGQLLHGRNLARDYGRDQQ